MWLFEKRLSRVHAFIELAEQVDRPSMPAIAAALGVSKRTIGHDFHQLFGIGPARYLRLRRMVAARRALLAREGSVTRIAVAHGFTELGRFAAEYRAVFGDTPSQTLKVRDPGDHQTR